MEAAATGCHLLCLIVLLYTHRLNFHFKQPLYNIKPASQVRLLSIYYYYVLFSIFGALNRMICQSNCIINTMRVQIKSTKLIKKHLYMQSLCRGMNLNL